jgi:hypothetical protein
LLAVLGAHHILHVSRIRVKRTRTASPNTVNATDDWNMKRYNKVQNAGLAATLLTVARK